MKTEASKLTYICYWLIIKSLACYEKMDFNWVHRILELENLAPKLILLIEQNKIDLLDDGCCFTFDGKTFELKKLDQFVEILKNI